jgi:hypothetical protein
MSITWAMDPQIGGACLLVASEVPNFLAGALPSFMTIKKFAADEESVRTLRYAELFALPPVVAVGFGAALVFGSWWPLVVTGATAAYYYAGYEKHIRNPSGQAVAINDQNTPAPGPRTRVA